jgi:predicted ATPase
VRLERVQITNFRCINDSQEFTLADVTCLVGKNESGKTAILQALERLQPFDAARNKYDRLRDYPREHLSEYAERHAGGEANVVRTVWRLSPDDIAAVEERFGPRCLQENTVEVSKAYGQEKSSWIINIDQPRIVRFLLDECGVDAEERSQLMAFGSLEQIHADLTARTPALSAALRDLKARLDPVREHRAVLGIIDLLQPRMPRFLYFSNYDRMSGDVSIDQLRQDIQQNKVSEGDHVFRAFLEFAGTTLDELAGVTHFEELRAHIESASIRLTRQIFEYWSQNRHLKVTFTIDAGRPGDPPPFNAGTIMRARIYNQFHDMTVPFNDRSAGFVWFFSFLVLFSQVKKNHGNVIILLDEPGLNLHAKAQGDLLRFFKEKLRPEHQVIYTTHSPFLVPPDDLASVRTVEDVVSERGRFEYESLGTKVGDHVLSTDRDTLLPLQGALAYEVTQSLVAGEHTLLVEGPSEILYLQAISAELAARKRTSLSRRWTVSPCNGIDKVQAFMSLFAASKPHVAVLLGLATGQKSQVEKLRRSELLRAGHILTIGDFCAKEEGSLEDMFDPDLFAAILNGTYPALVGHKLTGERLLQADAGSDRLVRKAEQAMKILLAPGAPEFGQFAPASWLIQHPEVLKGEGRGLNVTLDKFENLFVTLNSLLN